MIDLYSFNASIEDINNSIELDVNNSDWKFNLISYIVIYMINNCDRTTNLYIIFVETENIICERYICVFIELN